MACCQHSGIPHLTPALSAPRDGEGGRLRRSESKQLGTQTRLRARTDIARRLRRNATEVEKRLWRALRELDTPYRFRGQHPIGSYIVDFACPARKLAIELDGGQHAAQATADPLRTEEIAKHGYKVIRFWNGDVTNNLPGVLDRIREELAGGGRENALSALQGGEGGPRREALGG